MEQIPLGVRLRERATFEGFVAGSNLQAVARVRASVEEAARAVVWLWGSEGSGRTHLLLAACTAASLGTRVVYLPLAEIGATAADFIGSAAEADLLCLDDLDTIVGDPVVERVLFAVYRRLEERGARILAAAAAPPAALAWNLADIGSRFAAAEIFQLRALDEAGCEEALRRRAAARGLDLPEETARYLLRRIPRDMRSLDRLLDEIDVAALSAQRRLTVPFVRGILGES